MSASPLRWATGILLLAAACSRGPVPGTPEPISPRASGRPAHGRGGGGGCAGLENGSSHALATEAWSALDDGANDRGLACANAALALDPRSVSALAARGAALAALDKPEDARTTFVRALAIDPDDLHALHGAAELYVRRLGPARENLETGLELALRGVRASAARRDRESGGRLALVAGMAENDLGRSHLALPHLERAVAALPDDPEAIYEKGVALFELCRFDEAQRAFEKALTLSPDDPWALHQLGLLAERRGEERRASQLLARAHTLAPRDFESELRIGPAEFKAEVQAALARLPEEEKRALKGVQFVVQDLPDAEDLRAVQPPLSPSILGLFRGPPEQEDCVPADGPVCRTIVIYRKNLLRIARDRKELVEQVRITVEHEVGHLHGLDEDELREIGLE
jgi:predicted Zn-dependent protease with MMP-like domain/Flp pilus assembly protein TadD